MPYLYQQLQQHFQQAITSGALRLGQKMPSLRQVCAQYHCALSVAQQAYGELALLGHIRAEPKSGYYVSTPSGGERPVIPKAPVDQRPRYVRQPSLVHEVLSLVAQTGLVPLHGAIPPPELLPVRSLQRNLQEVLRQDPALLSRYTPPGGSPRLRQEIARLMVAKGVHTLPDNILVTNGCSEALYWALLACSAPGDTVAIESPAYFGMVSMLENLGRKALAIPVDPSEGMEVAHLEKWLARTRIACCLVTPSFHNPTGALMPMERRLHLLQLTQRHGFAVIEDDIYGDCGFSAARLPPLKALDTTGQVIYCSSFAKTLAPGLRIGWTLASDSWLSAMEKAKQRITLGNAYLLQDALALFLQKDAYARHLLRFRQSMARQTAEMRQRVLRHFPPGTRVSDPAGGYFLWVELPPGVSGSALFHQARAQGIGIIPGEVFSLRGSQFSGYLRLSCAHPLDERLDQALGTLGKLIDAKRV